MRCIIVMYVVRDGRGRNITGATGKFTLPARPQQPPHHVDISACAQCIQCVRARYLSS